MDLFISGISRLVVVMFKSGATIGVPLLYSSRSHGTRVSNRTEWNSLGSSLRGCIRLEEVSGYGWLATMKWRRVSRDKIRR